MPLSDMATATGVTSIVVSPETLATVRACKTGGETYDDLLPKMAEQYDPHAEES